MLALSSVLKYVIEGLAVGLAVYLVAGKKSNITEIILLGLTAGVTFMILDLFTSGIGMSARQGTGFGIGIRQTGLFGGNGSLIAPVIGEGFVGETDNQLLNTAAPFPPELQTQYTSDRKPNYKGFTVGEDISGNKIGYDPETHEFGKQKVPKKDKINYLNEVPYRFPNVYQSTCPQKPAGSTPNATDYGTTKTRSRWMNFVEGGKPINCNTNDYKIVQGLYSKYIVQPGYREGIKPANSVQTDELAPTIWPTKNPLDKRHFMLREPFVPEDPAKKKTTM